VKSYSIVQILSGVGSFLLEKGEYIDGPVLTKLKAIPELVNMPVFVISIVDDENKGFPLGASE
jgi:hypothetical protein